jgi:hypothetical protein
MNKVAMSFVMISKTIYHEDNKKLRHMSVISCMSNGAESFTSYIITLRILILFEIAWRNMAFVSVSIDFEIKAKVLYQYRNLQGLHNACLHSLSQWISIKLKIC